MIIREIRTTTRTVLNICGPVEIPSAIEFAAKAAGTAPLAPIDDIKAFSFLVRFFSEKVEIKTEKPNVNHSFSLSRVWL